MWMEWVIPLWTNRNELKHGESNTCNEKKKEELTEKLLWYVEYNTEVLACGDYFLAKFYPTKTQRMCQNTKKHWIRNIVWARKLYKDKK